MTESKKIIKVSPSTLALIQSCSRAANYSKILRYSSRSKPEYMTKGEIAHKGLELFYKKIQASGGILKQEGIEESISLMRNEIAQSSIDVDTGEDMILTMKDYFSYWNDSHLEVLAVETPFSVVLHEDEHVLILLEGKWDLVVLHKEFNKRIVIDHKTGDQNQTPNLLDIQYSSYAYAGQTQNVMENRITWGRPKKSKFDPASKFHRTSLTYTDEFLEEFRNESIYWILKFHEEIEHNYFPSNRKSCKFCQFKNVCQWPDEGMRRSKLEMDFVQVESYDLFEGE